VIVCLRTIGVPPEERERFLAWIEENRAVREAHGILAELVLEPSSGEGETVVLTAWSSHEAFDAWIAPRAGPPHRLGRPPGRRLPPHHPLRGGGGYLNLAGLAVVGPAPQPNQEDQP
jgi:hypothetical protein